MPILTKSKFMNGIKCLHLLWQAEKGNLPELTLAEKQKIEQGSVFEEQVKKLFPDGVDLAGLEFNENIQKAQEAIQQNKLIFEAGIKVNNFFIRADILQPTENGWNLCEIKASTKVKPEHIPDLAFQKFVCEKAGLKIDKCFVYFLNKEYVKNGEINAEELVLNEEVTEKVNEYPNVEEKANLFLEVLSADSPKAISECISKSCNNPRECPLKQECWGTLPKNNVLLLTNWRQYWSLFEEGITDVKNIPEGTILTDKDQVIKEAHLDNKTIISKEHIKHFLNSLNYPLYHFDFETFDTGVPIYDKSRPWQKIPFQYSLHIEQEDGSTEHHEFLSGGEGDPRIELLEAMKQVMGEQGDVIVFNQTFEIGRLKELAEDFPEHKAWIQNVLDRIVDLAIPFKNFYYYDPSQRGKYSIKKVLPAVTGESYSELDINNGGDASARYYYSHIDVKLDGKEEIRKNLLKYCCLDTEGMVWIINKLKGFIH